MDLLQIAALRRVGALAVKQQVAVSPDYGKKIVKVMRNSPGKAADRFHLMRLAQPALQFPLFFLAPPQTAAHALKGTSHLSNFVVDLRFERVIEIAML